LRQHKPRRLSLQGIEERFSWREPHFAADNIRGRDNLHRITALAKTINGRGVQALRTCAIQLWTRNPTIRGQRFAALDFAHNVALIIAAIYRGGVFGGGFGEASKLHGRAFPCVGLYVVCMSE
jgi:hypothetical protein